MTPLRQRMREDMQVRNLSPHTQRAFIENVARFARHFGRSPADLDLSNIALDVRRKIVRQPAVGGNTAWR